MRPKFVMELTSSFFLLLMGLRTITCAENHVEYNVNGIVFVILSNPNIYHETVAVKAKMHIYDQFSSINMNHTVLIVPKDVPFVHGYWTIFPLIPHLLKQGRHPWFLFLEEHTEINVKNLLTILQKHSKEKNDFIGFALRDEQATIIHHFDDPTSSVAYPNLSSGMAVSRPLLQEIESKWKESAEVGFSIDAKYEFTKFVYENCDGATLTHEQRFCHTVKHAECATWISETFPTCDTVVFTSDVFFAVKTCHKFHQDRVPVVQNTWGQEADNIVFYSDVKDSTIPTINLGIRNTERGHCSKTFAIIKNFLENKTPEHKWLVIADDDSLFSVPRLLKLLSCYNYTEILILGERYGYATAMEGGYDYATGGSGMIFSARASQEIITRCNCPAVDSPDDMVIGMCLKILSIPIIHLPHLHQARPDDYNKDILRSYMPISFHKHWMTDPYEIYKLYLEEAHEHSEL